jgi:hypothetical protein
MGDKRRKRRPGREGPKNERKPRKLVITHGSFWVSVDTHTGDLECKADHDLGTAERDAVTAAVVDELTKYGFPPGCPLEVRDALFG